MKSEESHAKLRNLPWPLLRPRSIHFCQNGWNISREVFPLNTMLAYTVCTIDIETFFSVCAMVHCACQRPIVHPPPPPPYFNILLVVFVVLGLLCRRLKWLSVHVLRDVFSTCVFSPSLEKCGLNYVSGLYSTVSHSLPGDPYSENCKVSGTHSGVCRTVFLSTLPSSRSVLF